MGTRTLTALVAVALGAGCYDSHARPIAGSGDAGATCGASERPVCVAPSTACEPWVVVEAECGPDLSWRCPPGATEHARDEGGSCLPFEGTFERLGAIGPEVPVGAECLMLANGEVSTLGRPFEHVGTPMTAPVPFGGCLRAAPMTRPLLDRVHIGPDIVVDVMATLAIEGETWSLVRHFILDPDAIFGVTALGTEWVRHRSDGAFAPTGELFWGDEVYRSALVHDGWVYVFASTGEPGLIAPAAWSRVRAGRQLDRAAYEPGVVAFEVGPHFSVARHPLSGRFVMLTIEGFGDPIRVQTAAVPEGPWSPARTLARCALPADDPRAFCDGARLFTSRLDPTRPDELAVGYRIGTLAPDWSARRPEAYWPALVRATIPR